MYRPQSEQVSVFENASLFQLQGLDPDNAQIRLARLIPWAELERREAMPDDPGQADALIRAAHRDKLVLLTDPDLAMDFLDRGPLPEGWDKEAWYARPTFERLQDVGAFEEVDSFERVFVTP